HALEHEVIAGTGRIRTRLAETGDRAVDQARVDGAQLLVAQAVARQRTDFVVLDQDVAFRRELAHDSLALRLGDVQGHGFLAAVAGEIIGRIARVLAIPVLEPGRPPAARVGPRGGAFGLCPPGPEGRPVLGGPGAGEDA